MDEEAAFLAAIAAEPDEDVPRLAYADWLTENGRADYGEFVRVQVELARLPECDSDPPCRLLNESLPVKMQGWCANCCARFRPEVRERKLWAASNHGLAFHRALIESTNCFAEESFVWRRGFVEHVTCPAADWLTHGDSILAAHPVQEVTLTTWPQLKSIEVDGVRMKVRLREGGKEHELPGNTWHQYDSIRPVLRAEWPTVKTWNLPPDTSRFEVGTNIYQRDIMAAMREAGNRSAMRQNEAFLRAFLGE